jgi:hypothetical protein
MPLIIAPISSVWVFDLWNGFFPDHGWFFTAVLPSICIVLEPQ